MEVSVKQHFPRTFPSWSLHCSGPVCSAQAQPGRVGSSQPLLEASVVLAEGLHAGLLGGFEPLRVWKGRVTW